MAVARPLSSDRKQALSHSPVFPLLRMEGFSHRRTKKFSSLVRHHQYTYQNIQKFNSPQAYRQVVEVH